MSRSEVLDAFTRIRVAAETHMDHRDRERLGWSEETVIEVCSHQGLPVVTVIPFNRAQEGRATGADYLWWFLHHASSACFGMLVQGKRLTRGNGRWNVDIRHREGKQLADLLATARQLEVPAMYSVYTGGLVFPAEMPCSHDQEPDCLVCQRMAISVISAYQLADACSPTTTADLVLTDSLPLENLVDPDLVTGAVRDLNLREIPPGQLRDLLLLDQDGPLEVAKGDLQGCLRAPGTRLVGGERRADHDPGCTAVPRGSRRHRSPSGLVLPPRSARPAREPTGLRAPAPARPGARPYNRLRHGDTRAARSTTAARSSRRRH